MNYEINYINELMTNQPLDSFEDSESFEYSGLVGGNNSKLGGFPPISLCEKKTSTDNPFEENDTKKREYSKAKTSVSIKSILKERRGDKPFFDMNRAKK